jgi:MoxR-like ATPase
MLAGCRVAGAIILLDEPAYLTQGNVSVLNGILECKAPRTYRTAAGELVTFADDVAFFAADNTNGGGDASGQFIGTHAINPATAERYAYFIRLDYLKPKTEAKVLRAKTGAPKELCEGISSVMQACRQKASAGHIPSAPSMRGAESFLRAVMAGIPPQDAFEVAVTGRAVSEAQEELRALFAAHWPAALTPAAQGASPFGTIAAPDEKF